MKAGMDTGVRRYDEKRIHKMKFCLFILFHILLRLRRAVFFATFVVKVWFLRSVMPELWDS
jgi:hypothetical protein